MTDDLPATMSGTQALGLNRAPEAVERMLLSLGVVTSKALS
jgi:hypothetical protein